MKNPHTRKILGFILAGGVLLAGALFIYAMLVAPTKQPYRDARLQYQNVYNANLAVMTAGASLNATTATGEAFDKGIDAAKETFQRLQRETDALGEQSALRSDEGKELYEALSKKVAEYVTYNTAILTSMKDVRPIIYTCTQNMGLVKEDEQGAKAMEDCANQLASVSDTPDADYRTMAATFKEKYRSMATVLRDMAALVDVEGADAARYAILNEQREAIISDLGKASTTFSQNLQKNRQAVDITDAAKAMDDFLSKKSRMI